MHKIWRRRRRSRALSDYTNTNNYYATLFWQRKMFQNNALQRQRARLSARLMAAHSASDQRRRANNKPNRREQNKKTQQHGTAERRRRAGHEKRPRRRRLRKLLRRHQHTKLQPKCSSTRTIYIVYSIQYTYIFTKPYKELTREFCASVLRSHADLRQADDWHIS